MCYELRFIVNLETVEMVKCGAARNSVAGVLMMMAASGCSTINVDNASLSSLVDKPADNRLAFARLCERRNEDEKAQTIYERVLKEEPDEPTALHRLAVLATKRGQFEQAEKLFDRALAVQPLTAELANDLGYHYFLRDHLSNAEEQFRKAVELKPDYAPAWTNLGMTLGQQERFEESRAAFSKSAASAAEVHCNLAYVYAQLHQLEKAQAEYREALSLDPNLRVAAEGLLQISAHIPGQAPVTIVSTAGMKNKSKGPEPSEESQALDAEFGAQPRPDSLLPAPGPLPNIQPDGGGAPQPMPAPGTQDS